MYTIKSTVFSHTFNRFLQNQAPADELLNRNRAQAWPEKAQKCTGQHSGRPTEPFYDTGKLYYESLASLPCIFVLLSCCVNAFRRLVDLDQRHDDAPGA